MSTGILARPADRPRPGPERLLEIVRARPLDLVALAFLIALGAVLRFVDLGHQGFWFDEGNTALLVHFSPGKMLGLIPKTESTPPLYYCVAWVWARVFGYGESGLRSLSAAAGVLTVPIVFLTARIALDRRAAVIAAALTACNPFLIWYSQEARSYALLVLLTSVALLTCVMAAADPSPRMLARWVVAAALALATHYYALLAVVPQAVWLLARHHRRRAVQLSVGVTALCGLALIPLAISQNGTGNANWIAHLPLAERLGQIVPQFVIGPSAPSYDVLEPIAAAVALIGLGLLLSTRARRRRTRASPADGGWGLTFAGFALAGLLLILLLVAAGIDDLLARNVIALWVPAALAVAAGLACHRPPWLGKIAAAVACATGIATVIGIDTNWKLERPDWRAVAHILGPPPPRQSRVVLIQQYRDLLPLSLYEPGLSFWRSGASRTVREIDVVTMAPGLQEPACWWGAACNLIPAAAPAALPITGFHAVWVRRARQFTVTQFTADRPVPVSAREIGAALHTTELRHDGLLIQS